VAALALNGTEALGDHHRARGTETGLAVGGPPVSGTELAVVDIPVRGTETERQGDHPTSGTELAQGATRAPGTEIALALGAHPALGTETELGAHPVGIESAQGRGTAPTGLRPHLVCRATESKGNSNVLGSPLLVLKLN